MLGVVEKMAQVWENPDENDDTLGAISNGFETKSWELSDTWPWEFEPQQAMEEFWNEMQAWRYPAWIWVMLSDKSIGKGANWALLAFQRMIPPEFSAKMAKLSPVFFWGVLLILTSAFVTMTAEWGAEKIVPSCPNRLLPWHNKDLWVEIRQMWLDPDEMCKVAGNCWTHIG